MAGKKAKRRTKTERAARPAAHDRARDFTARLVERLERAGVPVVEALTGEEAGERALARFGLDDGKKMLRALAESLHGRGDQKMLGHASVKTTERYSRVDVNAVKAAVRALDRNQSGAANSPANSGALAPASAAAGVSSASDSKIAG